MRKQFFIMVVAIAAASFFTSCSYRNGGKGVLGAKKKIGPYNSSGYKTTGIKTMGNSVGAYGASSSDLSNIPEYSGPTGTSGSSGSYSSSGTSYGSGSTSYGSGSTTYGSEGFSSSGDTISSAPVTYSEPTYGSGSEGFGVSSGFNWGGGYDANGNPVQGGLYSSSGQFVGDTGGYNEDGVWVGPGGPYNSQGVFFGTSEDPGTDWAGGYDSSGNWIGANGFYDQFGNYIGDTGGYDEFGSFVGKTGRYNSRGEYFGSSIVSRGPVASDSGSSNWGSGGSGDASSWGSSYDSTTEIRSVLFGYDRAAIASSEMAVISAVANYLENNPGSTVKLAGHADERGSSSYNLSLGDRRANAVKDALVNLGVNPNRLTTISYGSEAPLDHSHTESAWSQNRRVEFDFN